MRTKIRNIGSDCGIILDRPMLDALNISPEAEVDIRVEKESLVVCPVRETQHNAVAEAFHRLLEHPEDILKGQDAYGVFKNLGRYFG
jgi:antitoxin component of MazEF toxin-antitoxin module